MHKSNVAIIAEMNAAPSPPINAKSENQIQFVESFAIEGQ